MARPEDIQDRILEELQELVKWAKVTSIPRAKKVLEDMLSTGEQRRAYQHSTGDPAKDVSKLSGAGRSTVTTWWKKWHRAGLGELRPARGGNRFFRSFDLEDFDIPVTPLGAN
ncbi:MAG: helix-turn-helix domain-containing protein [Thermoplasmata archaeon]